MLPSWLNDFNYLQETVFKDFLQWAILEMTRFYHNKGIGLLKIGLTLLNLANIGLHKPSNYKFYPFFESDNDLCEKKREDLTDGPTNVITRKTVVDKTFIRNSSNVRKSIVGIDSSQLYPSQCVKIWQQD